MIKSRLHGLGYMKTEWTRSYDGYRFAYAVFFGKGVRKILRSELEPVMVHDVFSVN